MKINKKFDTLIVFSGLIGLIPIVGEVVIGVWMPGWKVSVWIGAMASVVLGIVLNRTGKPFHFAAKSWCVMLGTWGLTVGILKILIQSRYWSLNLWNVLPVATMFPAGWLLAQRNRSFVFANVFMRSVMFGLEPLVGLLIFLWSTVTLFDIPELWLDPRRGLAFFGVGMTILFLPTLWVLTGKVANTRPFRKVLVVIVAELAGVFFVAATIRGVSYLDLQSLAPLTCSIDSGCTITFPNSTPSSTGNSILLVQKHGRMRAFRLQKRDSLVFESLGNERHLEWGELSPESGWSFLFYRLHTLKWNGRWHRPLVLRILAPGARESNLEYKLDENLTLWPADLDDRPILQISPDFTRVAVRLGTQRFHLNEIWVFALNHSEITMHRFSGFIKGFAWLDSDNLIVLNRSKDGTAMSAMFAWTPANDQIRSMFTQTIPGTPLSLRRINDGSLLAVMEEPVGKERKAIRFVRFQVENLNFRRGFITQPLRHLYPAAFLGDTPLTLIQDPKKNFQWRIFDPITLQPEPAYIMLPYSEVRYLAQSHDHKRFAVAIARENQVKTLVIERMGKVLQRVTEIDGQAYAGAFLDNTQLLLWNGRFLQLHPLPGYKEAAGS